MTYTIEEQMHQDDVSSDDEEEQEPKHRNSCSRFLISPHNERKQKFDDFIAVISIFELFFSIYQ